MLYYMRMSKSFLGELSLEQLLSRQRIICIYSYISSLSLWGLGGLLIFVLTDCDTRPCDQCRACTFLSVFRHSTSLPVAFGWNISHCFHPHTLIRLRPWIINHLLSMTLSVAGCNYFTPLHTAGCVSPDPWWCSCFSIIFIKEREFLNKYFTQK